MTRECHVRFWERVGVRLPHATRQVCLMIGGKKHWLWRAVDQDRVVLDVLDPNTPVHSAGPQGVRRTSWLDDLLPFSFGPDNLAGSMRAQKP